MQSTTLFAEGNIVLCPLIYNDVLALLEMMLRALHANDVVPAAQMKKSKSFDLDFLRRNAQTVRKVGKLALNSYVKSREVNPKALSFF